jgi:polar amino acid transport system substrate-binding protein
MRVAIFGGVLASLALVLAATATGSPSAPAQSGSCAKANLNLVNDGRLSVATDNPAVPPWWGGAQKKPWEVSNPASGKGYESAVAYAVAKQLGFSKGQVGWSAVPFNNSFRPGNKPFDFYMAQVSFAPERAKNVSFSNSYYFVNQAVVANGRRS